MFKKGIKTEAKNYRPISLLPLRLKVKEKSIHNQTQDFIQRNGLLHIHQSGFRANHSTHAYLYHLTDIVLNGAENSKHAGLMTLMHHQKTFDSLDHKISLNKMKYIGFSNKAIKWFHSYLANKAFFVPLKNVLPEARTINCEGLQ